MVNFSQTPGPFTALMSVYHRWECVESLRCVEVEKKKKKRLQGSIALEYAEGISPFGPKMLCQNGCYFKGLALVPVFVERWHLCLREARSISGWRDQNQCFKGCNVGYQLPTWLFIFV